VQVSVNISHTS